MAGMATTHTDKDKETKKFIHGSYQDNREKGKPGLSHMQGAQTNENYQYHLEICVLKLVACEECRKTFKSRKRYLRHLRKKHQNFPNDSGASAANDGNESDWEEQSECEVVDDSELGPTVSKRTPPSPVFTPPPKKCRIRDEGERSVAKVIVPNTPVIQVTQGTESTVTQATQETSVTERPRGQFSMACKIDKEGELVKKSVVVSDEGGEVFSSSSPVRGQRARVTEIKLKDVIEEDRIDVNIVVFRLGNDGEVRVDCDCK